MENLSTQAFAKQDKEGNVLFIRQTLLNGAVSTVSIVLKLAGHKRYRNIGLVTAKDNTLHVKRSSNAHYHVKAKGYWFNWEMLSEKSMFRIDHIHMIVDDTKEYLFPKAIADQYGTFMFFKEQNFELQRFIPFALIEPFEYKKKEVVNESL